MSAGRFVNTIYQNDNGDLFAARTQPETLAMTVDGTANAGAAGPLPAGVASANMGGSRRKYGVNARRVNLKLPEGGTPPAGYKGSNLSVPVMTNALFAAISKSSTIVYLETTWEVAGTTREQIR